MRRGSLEEFLSGTFRGCIFGLNTLFEVLGLVRFGDLVRSFPKRISINDYVKGETVVIAITYTVRYWIGRAIAGSTSRRVRTL